MRGRVRFATAENLANFLVLPELGRFRQDHPGLTIEVLTDIGSVNLHRRDADLSLRLVRPDSGDVSVRRLGTQHHGPYGSSAYFSEAGRRGSHRLEDERLISWSSDYSDLPPARWVEDTLGEREAALVLSSLYGQYTAIREGLGLAVLPCSLGDGDSDLRRLRCDADGIRQDLWLVIHSDLAGSARVRSVANLVIDVVQRNADRLAGTVALRRRLTRGVLDDVPTDRGSELVDRRSPDLVPAAPRRADATAQDRAELVPPHGRESRRVALVEPVCPASRRDRAPDDHPSAKSIAARACRSVVSKAGTVTSAGAISNPTSVQPNTTPSAPCSTSRAMMSSQTRLDPSATIPWHSSS